MRARMKPNDRTNLSLSPIPLAVSKIIFHLHFSSFLLLSPDFLLCRFDSYEHFVLIRLFNQVDNILCAWISLDFVSCWFVVLSIRWIHNRTRRVKRSSRVPAKTDLQVKEMRCLMTPATPRGSYFSVIFLIFVSHTWNWVLLTLFCSFFCFLLFVLFFWLIHREFKRVRSSMHSAISMNKTEVLDDVLNNFSEVV